MDTSSSFSLSDDSVGNCADDGCISKIERKSKNKRSRDQDLLANPEEEHTRGSWKDREDEALREIIEKFGPKEWTCISAKMAQAGYPRAGKQCRERWFNHLDPSVTKLPWTPQEDAIIIRMHNEEGNKWTKISSCLQGRPANAVKNHWNSTLRRNLSAASKGAGRASISLKRSRDETEDDVVNASDSEASLRDSTEGYSSPQIALSLRTSMTMSSSFSSHSISSSREDHSLVEVPFHIPQTPHDSSTDPMVKGHIVYAQSSEYEHDSATQRRSGRSRTKAPRLDNSPLMVEIVSTTPPPSNRYQSEPINVSTTTDVVDLKNGGFFTQPIAELNDKMECESFQEDDWDLILSKIPQLIRDPLQETEPGDGYHGHYCSVKEQDHSAY